MLGTNFIIPKEGSGVYSWIQEGDLSIFDISCLLFTVAPLATFDAVLGWRLNPTLMVINHANVMLPR